MSPAATPSPLVGDVPNRPARAVAGILCGVEALALLVLCGFYVWEITRGASDSLVRASVSALLIAVVGAGLGMLSRGWLGNATWARTPTMVWNALLLPVAWSLGQSGHLTLALAVGALALVALGAAVIARADDQP